MQASIHGSPRPRKTLTELEPVTFPIAASAYYEVLAAVILAKVSGRDVPIATRVMPVTAGFSPITHPKTVATSPTTVVIIPIRARAIKNAAHPPHMCLGGTNAPNTFQNMASKWNKAAPHDTSSTIRFSESI